MIEDSQFFLNLGLAAALGALVGLEREKSKQEKQEISLGGIRTMIIVSLFGAAAAFFSKEYSPFVFLISFIGVVLLTAISHGYLSFVKRRPGITTELSVIFVFLLGALTVSGYSKAAFAIGIVIALMLSLREPIHNFIKRMSALEFLDTIKFAAIAFVVLPFLPNETLDPWGFFNPYTLWLYVVIFSGISFVGYILSRWLGARKGLHVTSFLAGFISSTATVSAIGQRAKTQSAATATHFIIAAILAFIGSLVPTLAQVFVVNIPLFKIIILPVFATCVLGVILILFLRTRRFSEKHEIPVPELRSPFSLSAALQFGIMLFIIRTLAVLAERSFGEAGIYATSVFSGIATMDAITLSMAELSGTQIPLSLGARAISLALAVSSVSKIFLLLLFGRASLALRSAPFFIILGALLVFSAFFYGTII